MNKSEQLIACLEGEIAKRDARIAELESRYQRDVFGLNNEGDPIGGDPAGGYANDNARLRTELAAIKAQDTVGEVVGWYRLDRPYEMTSYPSVCATWHKLGAPVAPLYAAPVSRPQLKLPDQDRYFEIVSGVFGKGLGHELAMKLALVTGTIHNEIISLNPTQAAGGPMTETINGVPRELLAELQEHIHCHHDAVLWGKVCDLLSAPSPAGLDGLDTDRNAAFKACPESGCDWGSFYLGWKARGEVEQAIIDGLRGENHQRQRELRLRQSQIESSGRIAERAQRFAVQLRTERDQQAQRIGELERLLREAYKYPLNHACETVDFTAQDLCERIDTALSAGKAQEEGK